MVCDLGRFDTRCNRLQYFLASPEANSLKPTGEKRRVQRGNNPVTSEVPSEKRLLAAQSPQLRLKLLKTRLCRHATGPLFLNPSLGILGAGLGGANASLSSQTTGSLFVVRAKVALRTSVEEPQPPVFPAHIQPQRIAVSAM